MVTNQDDCSGPQNTTIYSLNGYQQNIANPDGPIADYRCNGGPRGAHYCQDPNNGMAWMTPPLTPPSDAQGSATAPTLDLVNCIDNEQPPMGTGASALTPVSQFISDIKSLKPDPDNQILVAAIAAPAAPYTVEWLPASGSQNTQPGELWPSVMHSCGAKGAPDVNPEATMSPTDGSFGDPAVRISQFVSAFPNYVLASICDSSYAAALQGIATSLASLMPPPCITGAIAIDAQGNPRCSVIESVTKGGVTTQTSILNCGENGNAIPCWNMSSGNMGCAGSQLSIVDPGSEQADAVSATITCELQLPSGADGGCVGPPGTPLP